MALYTLDESSKETEKGAGKSCGSVLTRRAEVEERRGRGSGDRKADGFAGGKWEVESPKSGSSWGRAKSWEGWRWRGEGQRKQRGVEKKPFGVRECCCWEGARCECGSVVEWGSSSACGFREEEHRNLRTFSRWSSPERRRGRSSPCAVGLEKRNCSEADLRKMKRSLKLLGLDLTDFGIYSGGEGRRPSRKPREQSARFRTKVSGRSISLECLRESVRRAWEDDRLDESHRRVLAQAAYEEWYFRKERELWEKQKEERVRMMKAKGSLLEDIERKKEKSEEEFKKWLQRKKAKRKENKELPSKKNANRFGTLMKTREEIEEAFQKWKKAKDEELERKKREKKREEEKQKASERQKAEKKATAEKAFLLWKTKVEENERLEEEKRQRRKARQEELRRRRKGEKENAVSFQIWKEAKDEEMKIRIKQMREMNRIMRQERLAQMEERMYEAEQAFEDWLDKVDSRKQKQFCSVAAYQKTVPWIPA